MKNYYLILGLSPDASKEEIKDKYVELLHFYHPDKWQNDPKMRTIAEERTREIIEAFETLGDSFKRSVYDEEVEVEELSGEKRKKADYEDQELQEEVVCPVCRKNDRITKLSGINKVAPPPKPMRLRHPMLIPVSILIGAAGIALVCSNTNNSSTQWMIVIGVVVVLGIVSVPMNRSMEERLASELAIYHKAIERWNQFYYCERDDRVFDPDTREYVMLKEIDLLLYK